MTIELTPGFYKCRDGKKRELLAVRDGLAVMHGSDGLSCYLPKELTPWQDEPEAVTGWVYMPGMSRCRRITYTPGRVLSEAECLAKAGSAYNGSLPSFGAAFLEAWKQGRVWDSTPEEPA